MSHNLQWSGTQVHETQGFWCLGHSNWTICSILSQFCSLNFSTFQLSCWEANSYYPKEWKAENGKMELSQPESGRGISVSKALELDHLRHFKPILFPKFSNFSTFMMGANSYYPRERQAQYEKIEFSQPESDRCISVPGAFKLD